MKAGVIGFPVEHSLSPRIHLAAAKAVGINLAYEAIPVMANEVGAAISAMRDEPIRGYSVTMPHKETVIEFLDELTPSATALGAVNHITNTNGWLTGNNTDGNGFVLGLEHSAKTSVRGKTCGVIGSGGAARAIIEACARHGAKEVVVVARSAERAQTAALLAGDSGRTGDGDALGRCDVVVNATPIGMAHTESAGQLPCDVEALSPTAVVIDIVYNPLETPLLTAVAGRGMVGVNGLSMLVGQAAEQFSAWTGVPAPLREMFASVSLG